MADESKNKVELYRNRVSRIGERSVSGAFASLLSLTSEAVLVFDGSGTILLANDEAQVLLMPPREGFVGSDVRLLFPPAVGVAPDVPFSPESLPFLSDGSSQRLSCVGPTGALVDVTVRCDRVRAPGETYLLVAHASDTAEASKRDHDRLVEELSRANKRLSGTLHIVLGTLASQDVSSLFHDVLDEITDTMGAAGTILYVAESGGLHLRGTSAGIDAHGLPRFIGTRRGVDSFVGRAGKALRFRVLPPDRQSLRRGKVRTREVVDEDTHETHSVPAATLPPFVSFIAVPVWFDGHVIALIDVGWHEVHPTRREDAQLLDAVAEYLSVQLMGALTAMRQKRAERLDNLASEIREHLVSSTDDLPKVVADIMDSLGGELGVTVVSLAVTPDGGLSASLPVQGACDLPVGLSVIEEGAQPPCAVLLPDDSEFCRWLRDRGEPSSGALVDFGELGGRRTAYLVLRGADAEPITSLELSFLKRLVQDVREAVAGSEAHEQDRHISQALQLGMRNELQEVPGISAQGLYSSATASAFVGGDFYDLVRLPERCACVIMGDVSGKGVEAASVSAAVKTALGAYAWEGLTPARMVRTLNNFLLGFSRLETFATLFVGIVDLAAGTLTYCSAGHPPAVLMRAATHELVMLDVQSGVVGAFKDMLYQDGVVTLGRGDALVLYTDGTTEARDPEGNFFGEDGLRDMLATEGARGFEGLCDRMMATLDAFTGNNLEDDVALVALRFDDVGEDRS